MTVSNGSAGLVPRNFVIDIPTHSRLAYKIGIQHWHTTLTCYNPFAMFHVRNIYLDEARVEAGKFDIVPTNPQGEAVCALIAEFLINRPPEFRDKLSFLKRGNLELDWSAVAGGVALASLFEEDKPAAMSILLTGLDPEADRMMLDLFRDNVLRPVFDSAPPEQVNELVDVSERPLLLQALFPISPEWAPTIQLLSTALASVYFRTILQLSATAKESKT